jgi:pantoate--beta-alanine ligase
MKIIKDIIQMQQVSNRLRAEGKAIGFVPTMGYLHEGHLSLMRLVRPKCQVLVVSIFVNPAQFGPNEDLDQYPRDFKRDENLCKMENVDIIFYPDTESMYPKLYYTFVNVNQLSEIMCGLSRPNHFRGVTTIVSKLFNIVKPNMAAFGQKDYQQLTIIKRMVKDLNYDIQILTGPTVRESDGLALSSRNKYLDDREREKALALYQSLLLAENLVNKGELYSKKIKSEMELFIKSKGNTTIDYIEIADGDTLEKLDKIRDNTMIALAVIVGKTRLIDNIVIRL